MRSVLLLVVLLAACEATAPPPPPQVPAAQREVTERVITLGREIDELGKRYESLLKQNAAIEELLAKLGFTLQMTHDTVAQRVEMMRRFERAEAARTATYERLRSLLRTLATQMKVDTDVEVRGGQIVVRIAEGALFDAKHGRLRAEATPLLWAVADGLKEFAGRRFEVVAEVARPPAPAPAAAPGKGKAKARRKAKGKPAADDGWADAARRATEVMRALAGTGLGERVAAMERGPDPAAAPGARFIEIVVLPTRDELPRVHGATDTAGPPAAPAPPAPARP